MADWSHCSRHISQSIITEDCHVLLSLWMGLGQRGVTESSASHVPQWDTKDNMRHELSSVWSPQSAADDHMPTKVTFLGWCQLLPHCKVVPAIPCSSNALRVLSGWAVLLNHAFQKGPWRCDREFLGKLQQIVCQCGFHIAVFALTTRGRGTWSSLSMMQMDNFASDSTWITLVIQSIHAWIAHNVKFCRRANPCCTFLWSCAPGNMQLCSVPPVCFPAPIMVSCWLFQWTPAKKVAIWIFGKSRLCASLRMLTLNCQKRVANLPKGYVNLIKMFFRTTHCKFLICDTHRQQLWWNIVVGNFTPKPQNKIYCWQLRSFVTRCWWLMSTFQVQCWFWHKLRFSHTMSSSDAPLLQVFSSDFRSWTGGLRQDTVSPSSLFF